MASVQGIPQLQARLRAIDPTKGDATLMKRLALSTVREAKLLVPRKTSNLGRSIHVARVTPKEAVVEAGANYAAFVELGTRPHEITPKAKKALRWAATAAGRRLTGSPRKAALRGGLGGVVFAKRVHHPGTRPHPYLLPGAVKAVQKTGLAATVISQWNGAA